MDEKLIENFLSLSLPLFKYTICKKKCVDALQTDEMFKGKK